MLKTSSKKSIVLFEVKEVLMENNVSEVTLASDSLQSVKHLSDVVVFLGNYELIQV